MIWVIPGNSGEENPIFWCFQTRNYISSVGNEQLFAGFSMKRCQRKQTIVIHVFVSISMTHCRRIRRPRIWLLLSEFQCTTLVLMGTSLKVAPGCIGSAQCLPLIKGMVRRATQRVEFESGKKCYHL